MLWVVVDDDVMKLKTWTYKIFIILFYIIVFFWCFILDFMEWKTKLIFNLKSLQYNKKLYMEFNIII